MPRLVAILGRMRSRDVNPDYTYYGIASPWLQARLTRYNRRSQLAAEYPAYSGQ